MLKKCLAVAAVLSAVCGASSALAAEGTYSFANVVADSAVYTSAGIGGAGGGLGGDFTDTLTFGNLAATAYNVSIDLSGQNLGNGFWATLFYNGGSMSLDVTQFKKFTFASLEALQSPVGGTHFDLEIGSTNAGTSATYSGSFQIAAVPEPTAAAMLIAGFAVMGFIAMRRRRQD